MKNDDVIKTKIADILTKNKVECFRAIPCPRCDTYEDVFDLLLSEIKREREDTSTVTRFEVIDETGRAYVRYDVSAKTSLQDDDQTLKVFVKPKQGESEGV